MTREGLQALFAAGGTQAGGEAFVRAFLTALGGFTPVQVDRYRPSRYGDRPTTALGFHLHEVARTGGVEGAGEYMDATFEVKDEETRRSCFFTMTGRYDSWEGTEWDPDVTIVRPTPVTRIEYHTVE